MTNDNLEYYEDAYEIGYEKVIDTYAAATQHVDQGLSLTLFFKDTATTRDINKAQIYAWRRASRPSTTSGSASRRWRARSSTCASAARCDPCGLRRRASAVSKPPAALRPRHPPQGTT